MSDLGPFSPDYTVARRRFREAATRTRWPLEEYSIGTAEPSGENLTTESATGQIIAVEPARIRIATYNINWGNPNLEAVVATIRDSKADIVCLQETSQRAEAFLRHRLATEYPHRRFVGHDNRFGAERFGFMSRLPLKKLHFDPPKRGFFGTFYATVAVGKRDVRIADVHLSPFVVQRGSSISQAIAAIGKIETMHKEEIGRICKLVDPARPTLVVGDFNSLSTLAAPIQLTHVGMIDSYAAVHEDADAKFTWHWKLRVGELRFRIDYIFHSSHFKTLSSRILPSKGSDHYLLVSDLQMRNSEKTAP